MQIPEKASVKSYETANIGSLLIGRLNDHGANFVAVRADLEKPQSPKDDPKPYMVILSAWVGGHDLPYIYGGDPSRHGEVKVLDLGIWSVDIQINDVAPAFKQSAATVLIRSGVKFYIQLVSGAGYLDVDAGLIVSDLPDVENNACWKSFAILLPQSEIYLPGVEVFSWPHK